MSVFKQLKPAGLNPSKPGRTREGLTRVEFHLDKEDVELLDRMVATSGLGKRTRFIRWLVWTWAEVEEAGERYPALDPPVKLSLVKDGLARKVEVPDGWKKG